MVLLFFERHGSFDTQGMVLASIIKKIQAVEDTENQSIQLLPLSFYLWSKFWISDG